MPLLAEYALTPDVFDMASYSSEEVCGLHLQSLKEVLLHEGLVRDLRAGEWAKNFTRAGRSWHMRGKELLTKLATQRRLVSAPTALPGDPTDDAQWCNEALASHRNQQLTGIIATDSTAAPHVDTEIISSISKLTSANWWIARSPSVRLARTLKHYELALDLVLQHANSLMLIDPHIDPTNGHQYGDLIRLLAKLQHRAVKPLVELHRASWYDGGQDKIPKVREVVNALTPQLSALAKSWGISFDVFLWDDVHDRYLISDLIGISLPYGFATTKAPNAMTTWTRVGRADRDLIQRDFDPAFRAPRHRFKI